MRRVAVLRGTHIGPDPRAERLAAVLGALGWSATLVGWDRYGNLSPTSRLDLPSGPAEVHRLSVQGAYGAGARNLGPLSRWQRALWRWLRAHRAELDLVVAIDLDTAIPAWRFSRSFGVPWIYDIADFYAESRSVPRVLREAVARFESRLARKADGVLLCDARRAAQFRGGPPPTYHVLPNSPGTLPRPRPRRPGPFTACYIGILGESRFLLETVRVFLRRPEWRLVVGGFGPLEADVRRLVEGRPEACFLGGVSPYSRALELMADSDALFALYDPKVPNHRLSSPNKFYEAMGLGKPIVVARGTGIDEDVLRFGLGAVVDYGDEGQLEAAFADWASWDDRERTEFASRARARYEREFGFEAMCETVRLCLAEARVA